MDTVDGCRRAQGDHPGPICREKRHSEADLKWRDIGSGVMARTFPSMDKLIVTTKGGLAEGDVHRRIVRSLSTGKVIDDCVIDDVADEVLHRRLRRPDDVRVELVMKGAMAMYKRKGADVAEVYSQPRIAQEATARSYDGTRLVPGWSLDLTREDPETGRPWNLADKKVQRKVQAMVRETEPFMLIGSPPCTMFSTLMNLNKGQMKEEEYKRMMKEAKEHVKFCITLYKTQLKHGRFFLHEHPHQASSWKMPEMVELAAMPTVDMTTCDMCAYGMVAKDKEGTAPAEKRTKLLSNSPEVIKRVGRQCANKALDCQQKHRHADLTGGRAKQCQVYPREFCRAVCEGVAAQKRLMRLGLVAIPTMSLEEMLVVESPGERTGSPSDDLHEADAGYTMEDGTVAFDDQSGGRLKPEYVTQARKGEIKYFKDMGVYEKVDIGECWEVTGKAPIAVRWVDINKGDTTRSNYRSRLVAKEFRTDVHPDLYAATPPGECLRLMMSRMATNRGLKMMYADVSRAYFYAKAVRPVYVKLPEEDVVSGQDEGKCGKLQMSMYGTRDAALNWALEYTETLKKDGYVQGHASSCLFRHPVTGAQVMVHGDDFVAVGSEKILAETRKTLESKYKLKVETLGGGDDCTKEVRILNKVLRWTDSGLELQADPRDAELVVKELGLENAKASAVPGSKDDSRRNKEAKDREPVQVLEEGDHAKETSTASEARPTRLNWRGKPVCQVVLSTEVPEEDDEDSEWNGQAEEESEEDGDRELDASEAMRYRAITARLNYLAPDRPDIQYAVKEAARSMSKPLAGHWTKSTLR